MREWRVVPLLAPVGLALALAWMLAVDGESPPRASRDQEIATGTDGHGRSAVVSNDHPLPTTQEPTASEPAHRPFSLALWFDDGSAGAWVLLHSESAGQLKVTFRPRDRPDVDLMGCVGSAEAGSLTCGFQMEARTYEGAIEWDDAMRPVSFHLRTGKDQEGDRVTERHEIEGRAYLLERRRVHEAGHVVDVGLELKRAP